LAFGGEAAQILDEFHIYFIPEIVSLHTFTSLCGATIVHVVQALGYMLDHKGFVVQLLLQNVRTGCGTYLPFCCVYLGVFLWGLVGGSWTTHLHLVQGLRMCGAVHPLLYLVMARVLTLLNLKCILVNTVSTNAFASAYVGIVLIMLLMHILG
jgi:hypothetical protein